MVNGSVAVADEEQTKPLEERVQEPVE